LYPNPDGKSQAPLTGWSSVPWAIKLLGLLALLMIATTFGISAFLISKQSALRDALVQIQENQLLIAYGIDSNGAASRSLTNTWGEETLATFCHLLEFTCDDAEYLVKRNAVPNNNNFCSKVKNACSSLLQEAAATVPSPDISVSGLFQTLGVIPPGRLFNRPGPSSSLEGSLYDPNGAKLIQTEQLGMFVAFSYYGVPDITDPEVNDGVAWITLNSSLAQMSQVTYLYNSEKQGGFNNIYANLNWIVVPSPDTDEVFLVDISTGISNILISFFINSTTIFADGNVSRPWAAHQLTDGRILLSALEDAGGGGNGGLFTIDLSVDPPAVARWDSFSGPYAGNHTTPGDFCILDAESHFVQVGSLAPWSTVLSNPMVCFDNTTDLPLYGRQINLYNSQTREIEAQIISDITDITDNIGPVRPIPAFDDLIGAIPTVVRKNPSAPEIFGFASMYSGTAGIGIYTGASNSQPWTLQWTTQIPPLPDPYVPGDVNQAKLPIITDASFDRTGKFLFVAAYGLGQIRTYLVADTTIPQLCDVTQVTAGQNLFNGSDFTNPSCPGRVLDKGPAHLTPDPFNDFLYVSSDYVGITECIYPGSLENGGWMVRYRIDTDCRHGMLTQDPGFCVDGNTLPGVFHGNPARFGDMIFPAGDIKNPTLDTQPFGT